MMMTPGRACISGCEVPQTTVWADVCRVGVAARRMPRPEPTTPVVSGSLVWGPWKRLRILRAGGRGEERRPWNHLGNSRSGAQHPHGLWAAEQHLLFSRGGATPA